MVSKKSKNETRQKRHLRIRKNIVGSATCPRLVVFKSNSHIYVHRHLLIIRKGHIYLV